MAAEIVAFLLASAALLGSPGPGISALVAVGRAFPRAAALRFYASMQLGLALAAGISVVGLVSLLTGSATLQLTLMVVATVYLVWLAWAIASAPVGGTAIGGGDAGSLTNKGAFFLGAANPKAYLAFAALFGSFTILPSATAFSEGAIKWVLCVLVMLGVDFAWLALGMAFGRIALSPPGERAFNLVMGMTILAACVGTWL